jgi:predicted phosphodiesterase
MAHVPGPAAGRDERLLRRFPGCDAIVYGHTHVAVAELAGGVWILNPGSPTERRRASLGHSMLELRIEGGAIAPALIEL